MAWRGGGGVSSALLPCPPTPDAGTLAGMRSFKEVFRKASFTRRVFLGLDSASTCPGLSPHCFIPVLPV